MTEGAIRYALADRVATITLDRPEAMNAFGEGMREELLARLASCAGDPEIGAVVITGAGTAFCAGGDVASMAALQDRDDTSVVEGRIALAARIVTLIGQMPQPVVAAVNGAAAGGGMNLALACDIRLASDRAVFLESFVKIGLIPDWGGFASLPRLVGEAKAMELMMTGDRIDAAEALRLGLVNRVWPDADFRVAASDFARRLAAGPARTLAAIKRGVKTGAEGSLAEALAVERDTQPAIFLSADAREGMRAFLEKRPPKFGGGD